MKRNVLCIFSLALYLLLACTMLCVRIEEEMMPQAEVKSLKYKGTTLSFSPDVLFQDAQGEHFYHAANGTGWESGLRIKEFAQTQYYEDVFGQIAFSGTPQTYHFIMSASRQPVPGEKVAVIEQFEEVRDQYIYYYPEALPEDTWMPQHMQIKAQGQNVLLVETAQGRLPFFPHKAKTYSLAASEAEKVFSLTEIALLIKALPAVAGLGVLLCSGVILWGMAYCFAGKGRRGRLWGSVNIGLIMALLAASLILLNQIDLPASLLPSTSLFDWNAYGETFALIFQLLEQCGETALFSLWESTVRTCWLVLAAGVLAVAALGLVEMPGLKRRGDDPTESR